VTTIRLTNAAENLATDERASNRAGAPLETVSDHLPAIDAGPFGIRPAEARRPIPGFDGEEGEPFDIGDLVKQVESAAEAAVRAWPGAQPAARERAAGHSEVVELQAIRQKQAAALQRARNDIVSLDETTKLLRAQQALQEKEIATAKRALQQAGEEKGVLRAELEQANTNFAGLLQKTADLNAAFVEKEREIAALRKSVAALKTELAAKAGDSDLTVAIAEAKARYYNDFNKRSARFEAQIDQLGHMLGARDEKIRKLEDENAALTVRCEALAAKTTALEAAKQDAQKQLESQTAIVTFLDSTLQAERDSTGQKIAELTADLQRERLERAAEAHDSVTVCKAIVQLLPKLARQPDPRAD
jgi:chromosome segregation ATPase